VAVAEFAIVSQKSFVPSAQPEMWDKTFLGNHKATIGALANYYDNVKLATSGRSPFSASFASKFEQQNGDERNRIVSLENR